jgi:phosphomevalonate kinase
MNNKKYIIKINFLLEKMKMIKDQEINRELLKSNYTFLTKDMGISSSDSNIILSIIEKQIINRSELLKKISDISNDILNNYNNEDYYPLSKKDAKFILRK